MRVLMISWEYPPVLAGGLGRHVEGLARALSADGVGVEVVTRGDSGVETVDGVRVRRVAAPEMPRDLDAFLAWVGVLNRELGRAALDAAEDRVDLVHSHDWLVADAARTIAARLGTPWLVTVHATEHGRHRGRVARHPQSVIHAAERAMARDADHLLTCSDFMARHVTAVFGLPSTRVTALRNGIDLRALSPAPADLAALRRRHAADEQRLVLLAGRLVYEKGFDRALEALALLAAERDDLRHVIVGTGPAEAELRARARALGLQSAGTFLGWVDDVALHGLYRVADACLIPSRFEPFGIVALEALALGCPCVVAATGGLREIVGDDARLGLRVVGGDPGDWAAALARLLDEPGLAQRIVAAGRIHARGYDWPQVARVTAAIYARLLDPDPDPDSDGVGQAEGGAPDPATARSSSPAVTATR